MEPPFSGSFFDKVRLISFLQVGNSVNLYSSACAFNKILSSLQCLFGIKKYRLSTILAMFREHPGTPRLRNEAFRGFMLILMSYQANFILWMKRLEPFTP